MRFEELKWRGAAEVLSHAIVHMGRGHRVDGWGDGSYLDPAINEADTLLRLYLWKLEKELKEFKETQN